MGNDIFWAINQLIAGRKLKRVGVTSDSMWYSFYLKMNYTTGRIGRFSLINDEEFTSLATPLSDVLDREGMLAIDYEVHDITTFDFATVQLKMLAEGLMFTRLAWPLGKFIAIKPVNGSPMTHVGNFPQNDLTVRHLPVADVMESDWIIFDPLTVPLTKVSETS